MNKIFIYIFEVLQMKKENGITVIVLVVTVIIMLILAGVSIAIGLSDNGIITRSTQTELEVDKGSILEQINLFISDLHLNNHAEFGTGYKITIEDVVAYLANETYSINNKTFDNGKNLFKTPKKNGEVIEAVDTNKGFYADNYYWYMIDLTKIDTSSRYGKSDDWGKGNIFMIRRNYTNESGEPITLGNELVLVYKKATDDSVNNGGQEYAIVGSLDVAGLK
jgi:hypothetical protein